MAKRTVMLRRAYRVELNRRDLVAALRPLIPGMPDSGRTLCIQVRVPGGGNWSNTDLNVGDDAPLVVSWEADEEREEGR